MDNLRAFVRLLGDSSGEKDAVNWYKGAIFSVVGDDAANVHLLGFEGFSVCRTLEQEDGSFRNLQREVLYYTDRYTGEILSEWHNPITDENVPVVHVVEAHGRKRLPRGGIVFRRLPAERGNVGVAAD